MGLAPKCGYRGLHGCIQIYVELAGISVGFSWFFLHNSTAYWAVTMLSYAPPTGAVHFIEAVACNSLVNIIRVYETDCLSCMSVLQNHFSGL